MVKAGVEFLDDAKQSVTTGCRSSGWCPIWIWSLQAVSSCRPSISCLEYLMGSSSSRYLLERYWPTSCEFYIKIRCQTKAQYGTMQGSVMTGKLLTQQVMCSHPQAIQSSNFAFCVCTLTRTASRFDFIGPQATFRNEPRNSQVPKTMTAKQGAGE